MHTSQVHSSLLTSNVAGQGRAGTRLSLVSFVGLGFCYFCIFYLYVGFVFESKKKKGLDDKISMYSLVGKYWVYFSSIKFKFCRQKGKILRWRRDEG